MTLVSFCTIRADFRGVLPTLSLPLATFKVRSEGDVRSLAVNFGRRHCMGFLTSHIRTPLTMLPTDDNVHHQHHHQSLNREGRWGTTDDFATTFLHFSLFSTDLWDLPNSRPVHCLMLSSHLFLCPPCLLPPFTVPCKEVLARPDERET